MKHLVLVGTVAALALSVVAAVKVGTRTKTPAVGDSRTGIRFPGGDAIALVTAGVERLRVSETGGVGVGIAPDKKVGLFLVQTLAGGTDAAGIQLSPTYGAGKGDSAYALTIAAAQAEGSHVEDTIGIRIHDVFKHPGSDTTGYYSLLIDPPTAGSSINRAIYVKGGTSEFLGPVLLPTATAGTSTTQAATTAFVTNAVRTGPGAWATPAYSARHFGAAGGMTWVVEPDDVESYDWISLNARTILLSFKLSGTTVGGAPSPYLTIALPDSLTASKAAVGHFIYTNGPVRAVGSCEIDAGGTVVRLFKGDGGNWARGETMVGGQIFINTTS